MDDAISRVRVAMERKRPDPSKLKRVGQTSAQKHPKNRKQTKQHAQSDSAVPDTRRELDALDVLFDDARRKRKPQVGLSFVQRAL
jgi:hypothetical protein